MKLYIKYMASLRCKMIVREILKKKGHHYTAIQIGMIETEEELTEEEILQLKKALRGSGFELMNNPKAILVEKIKSVIIEMVYYCDEFPKQHCSEYISGKLKQDYVYLAAIFSEVKAMTIEQFIINHKIERIKELMLYEDQSLAEIAEQLCYDNVAHLSGQLEQFTGLTPADFMELKQKRKQYLENGQEMTE